MDRVNITTVTTAKGPAEQRAIGMYLIEKIHDGIPKTIEGFLVREHITSKELTLQLFANAIHIVNKLDIEFESIACYFDEPFITSAFQNNWIDNWKSNEWKTIKGKEIANAQTWKTVCSMIENCTKRFIYMGEKSSYTNWMNTQCMKKEKELEQVDVAERSIAEIKRRLGE